MSIARIRKIDALSTDEIEKAARDRFKNETNSRPSEKFSVRRANGDVEGLAGVVEADNRRVRVQPFASERFLIDEVARLLPPRSGERGGTARLAESQPHRSEGPPSGLLNGEYVTPEQLAIELGISVRTLHRWHTARRGPPRVVLGRIVFYRRSSVLLWIEGHEERPPRRSRR